MKDRHCKKGLLSLSMGIHIYQITITNMQFKYFKKLANFIKKIFLVSVNNYHMPTDHTTQHNMWNFY